MSPDGSSHSLNVESLPEEVLHLGQKLHIFGFSVLGNGLVIQNLVDGILFC